MLNELSVRNVGVVDHTSIVFTPGLNVLTGETGAGKTIILTSLGLVLGGKADSAFVRKNCEMLTVDAVWGGVSENVKLLVSEVDGEVEDGELLVSRTVNVNGRSKAVCGGRPVPASLLQNVSSNLIAVHGQSDQLKLKNVAAQRDALDGFCGEEMVELLGEYSQKYGEWVNLKRKLKKRLEDNANIEAEMFYAEMVRKDYDEVKPVKGEETTIVDTVERLNHVEELYVKTREMLNVLGDNDDDGGVDVRLNRAFNILQSLTGFDGELKNIGNVFEDLTAAAADAVNDLRRYSENIDVDVLEELNVNHERLNVLRQLVKKYNKSDVDELCDYMETFINGDTDGDVDSVEELETAVQVAESECFTVAEKITQLRAVNTVKLEEAVNVELEGLNMVGSVLKINHTDTGSLSPHGVDEVEFMIKTPSMVDAKPIVKAASGGELSRIMLALEVVLADPEKTPTFIFDEVDSGVGGATAIEIGKRLARLAKECQVIVVTHLPQVAVFADTHFKVVKSLEDDNVTSEVTKLDVASKEKELTRMFAGLEDSESGRVHAVELVEMAEVFKKTH